MAKLMWPMVDIWVARDVSEAAEHVATLCRHAMRDAVDARGTGSLCLAGGTTPQRLYEQLAAGASHDAVPWADVEFFFSDERDVPRDHAESNYRMARQLLLDRLPIDPARVHPMCINSDDPDASARDYERTLAEHVAAGADGVPVLDFVVLGIGADGHTASLFPESPMLDAADRWVMTTAGTHFGRRRMSLTLRLLNAARHVVMLVTGEEKAAIVRDVLGGDRGDRGDLPAARVAPVAGKLTVVLDPAAAALYRREA
jgi:6-phosphogluconolactonase